MSTATVPREQRMRRVASAMDAAGVDVLLLCPGADLYYLTGFEHAHAGERLLSLVVRRDGSSRWIVPAMNVPQVEPHALPGEPVRGWSDAEGYLPALRAALEGAENVAFDDEARASFLLDVISTAPRARLHRAGSVMRALRIRKDAAELAALRRAGRTVDETIPEALSFCRAGRTERQVEQDLRAALLRRASAGASVAFTIVASGENAALPHHETSDRKMRAGDVVVLDFGTREWGYHSDITVTCAVGEPSDAEAREVYRVVHAAQQAALRAVRPGASCESIDRAARSVIESAGYGQFFVHRTGHGLGLQVHEAPFMVGGNEQRLEEGMVFSVEPGIYLPGRFGVRLEVIAYVTSDGCGMMNAPRVPELPLVPNSA